MYKHKASDEAFPNVDTPDTTLVDCVIPVRVFYVPNDTPEVRHKSLLCKRVLSIGMFPNLWISFLSPGGFRDCPNDRRCRKDTIRNLNDPANVGWNVAFECFSAIFLFCNGCEKIRIPGSASAKDGPGRDGSDLPYLDGNSVFHHPPTSPMIIYGTG